MADLQIVRGTAPLPANVEDEFRLAYGREMNEQEREFYGLGLESATEPNRQDLPKAA
jgi:hypothetical protein